MAVLDTRVKLFFVLMLTTMALIFKDPLWMLGLCVTSLIIAIILNADIFMFFKRLQHFYTFLLIIFLVQIVFVRQGPPLFAIGDFTIITQDGLFRALNTGMRFFVILCTASIMSGENSRRVIQGLVQMHVPYIFAFMVNIALRFLPQFREVFSDALTSIQLRGIELKEVPIRKRVNLYGHLLLPVVADAIVKSQDLAVAMEARGFGAMPRRTSYHKLHMSLLDWTIFTAFLILGIIVIYLYFTIGG